MMKNIAVVALMVFSNLVFAVESKNVMIQSGQIAGSPVYWNSGWDVARKTAQHQLNLEKALQFFEYADFEISEENCTNSSELSEVPFYLCNVLDKTNVNPSENGGNDTESEKLTLLGQLTGQIMNLTGIGVGTLYLQGKIENKYKSLLPIDPGSEARNAMYDRFKSTMYDEVIFSELFDPENRMLFSDPKLVEAAFRDHFMYYVKDEPRPNIVSDLTYRRFFDTVIEALPPSFRWEEPGVWMWKTKINSDAVVSPRVFGKILQRLSNQNSAVYGEYVFDAVNHGEGFLSSSEGTHNLEEGNGVKKRHEYYATRKKEISKSEGLKAKINRHKKLLAATAKYEKSLATYYVEFGKQNVKQRLVVGILGVLLIVNNAVWIQTGEAGISHLVDFVREGLEAEKVSVDDTPSLITYMDASPEVTASMAMYVDEIKDAVAKYNLWNGMLPM